MAKFKIKIDGMSCEHCVGHIKDAFRGRVDKIDVKIGEAIIEGGMKRREIEEIIHDEGYTVVSVEEA